MKNLKKQDFYFIFSDLDCFYLPLNAYGSRTHFDWDTNIQFIDIQQYLLDFIARS